MLGRRQSGDKALPRRPLASAQGSESAACTVWPTVEVGLPAWDGAGRKGEVDEETPRRPVTSTGSLPVRSHTQDSHDVTHAKGQVPLFLGAPHLHGKMAPQHC